MKVFVLFLLVAFLFLGCEADGSTTVFRADGNTYHVIVIDGCEYLKSIYTLVHKGNCKNPIHIYREVEE